MAKHDPHPCKRQMLTHFHTKSYSDAFKCPVCGAVHRFNLNYLGNRRVPMCDGETIKAGEKLTLAEWQAATAKAREASQ